MTPSTACSGARAAIGAQVLRLARLVETLLDVARLAEGRLSLTPEPVDLSSLVRRVAEGMTQIAADAGCTLALQIPGPIEGVWDRARVEQMVSNLLSNAFKYGAGKPVDVEVEANDDTARVRVIDRGVGIPAGRHTIIFERFEGSTARNHYGGSAWSVDHAADLDEMGGAIRVDSGRRGRRARFEIELPAGTAPPPAP